MFIVYMWYKELNNLKYSLLLSEIDESFELKGRSKMDSDLVIDAVISGTTLLITVQNNTTGNMKGLLRMEVIQN